MKKSIEVWSSFNGKTAFGKVSTIEQAERTCGINGMVVGMKSAVCVYFEDANGNLDETKTEFYKWDNNCFTLEAVTEDDFRNQLK